MISVAMIGVMGATGACEYSKKFFYSHNTNLNRCYIKSNWKEGTYDALAHFFFFYLCYCINYRVMLHFIVLDKSHSI